MQRDALEKHSQIMLSFMKQQQSLEVKLREVGFRVDAFYRVHSSLGVPVTAEEMTIWKLEQDLLQRKINILKDMIAREEMHQRSVMFSYHQLITLYSPKADN